MKLIGILTLIAIAFFHFAWENFLKPRYTYTPDGRGEWKEERIVDEEETEKVYQVLRVGLIAIIIVTVVYFLA